MRILFVCSCNLNRSPTFEAYFKEKHPEVEVKSAGILPAFSPVKISPELVTWADRIIVMQPSHMDYFRVNYPAAYYKVESTNIEDIYPYMDRGLLWRIEQWDAARRITENE